jgi:hypothetical protein
MVTLLIRKVHFYIGIETPSPEPHTVTAFGDFALVDEEDIMQGSVGTEAIVVEEESAEADTLSRLATAYENYDPDAQAVLRAIGKALCDRISQCPGAMRGECWAMNGRVMRDLLSNVKLSETDEA